MNHIISKNNHKQKFKTTTILATRGKFELTVLYLYLQVATRTIEIKSKRYDNKHRCLAGQQQHHYCSNENQQQ